MHVTLCRVDSQWEAWLSMHVTLCGVDSQWEAWLSTHVTVCGVDSQWEAWLSTHITVCRQPVGGMTSDAGNPDPMLCNNPEGWGGEGAYVYLRLIGVDVWRKPSQCC